MSTISDLLGKLIGDNAGGVIEKLTGLTGDGSNNFRDATLQMKQLFATKQDMLDFLSVGWDKTKGGAGNPIATGASVASFLKIISDSSNFVDGIILIKSSMTKDQALFIVGQMWDNISEADINAVVEIPPVVVVEENQDPAPTPTPVITEIPGSQLGNAQGVRCFTNKAEATAFASEVLAAQTRAGRKPCPTYPKSFWTRVAAYSGGFQVAYGLNTWVASVKVGPCASTSTSGSTCTTGTCGTATTSTCSTGTCPTSSSTCSTGTCPTSKSTCTTGTCPSVKSTCTTGKCPNAKK